MNVNSTAKPFDTGADELERLALEECIKRQRIERQISVLIMPAGRCELPIQFARQGARITVADHASRQQEIEGRILSAASNNEISYVPCALPRPPEAPPGEPFDIIMVSRSLSALPYEEARQVVRELMLRLKIGGKLYISFLGLHSELSEGYPSREIPIEERFTELAPPLVEKYGIKGPVCLYTERNLFTLLLEAGASVLRTLTTTYGNVKGIAVRV